jgi:hypothetical protein
VRKYQSAWNRLRDNPNEPLVISAHPAYHRRIYKAIKKEKYIDTVHHMIVADQGKESKLSRKSVGNALTITLTISVALHGIF